MLKNRPIGVKRGEGWPPSAARRAPGPRTSRTRRRFVIWLVVWLLGGWGPLFVGISKPWAQEPTPETVAAPEVIPIPEVTARAEETLARLRDSEAKAQRATAVVEIETLLPALERNVRKEAGETRSRIRSGASRQALVDDDAAWRNRLDGVARSETRLRERAKVLEQELAALNTLAELWSRSSEAAAASKAPPAVRNRIRETLKAVRAQLDKVKERRSLLLTLQDRVARQGQVAGDVLAEIAQAQEALRGQLLSPDRPPIWQSVSDVVGGKDGRERLSAVVAERMEAIRSFLTKQAAYLAVFGVIFSVAFVGVLGLRRRIGADAETDPGFAALGRLFARPFSAALLVSAGIAAWLFPRAPSAVADLVGLLLIVPILRLLSSVLARRTARVVYGLSAFYLLDRVRDLAGVLPVIEQGLMLCESLGAIAAIGALLRPSRISQLEGAVTLLRAIGLWLRVGGIVFAVAGAAVCFGYVDLGRILIDGVLDSTYLAVALYAAVRVLEGILFLLLRTPVAQSLHIIRRHEPLMRARGVLLLRAAAILLLVFLALGQFTIREPILDFAAAILGLQLSFGTISISLGAGVAFALTLWGALLAARFVGFLLREDLLDRFELPRGVPHAISASSYYAILILGGFLALSAAGVDWSRFGLVAGALGVGVGFGLQNVVNNFVSGLILLFERPIQVGDTIEVENAFGSVERIGIRSSTIRTWQGAEVIVPNGELISARVTNWTLSDRNRRLDLPVGVAYGNDPERVIEILKGVADSHPDVLSEPAPSPIFVGFGESSLDFMLRAWTPRFDAYLQIQSDLAIGVARALERAGIEIPFPQRDLHVRFVAPELPAQRSEAEPDGEAEPARKAQAGKQAQELL